jgi:hypothetical protein
VLGFIVVYCDGMTLVAVEVGEGPLVEWVTPSLTVKRGRDPLGMQTITLDRIMPTLLPGVLALSERARYLAVYPFLLSLYEERRLAADNASLGEFIRLREYELCLAMQMCPRCSAAKAIGSERARPDVRSGAAEFPRRLSVESPMGGYGLYYRSPLTDLDVVIPAGAMLGETATRVDVLARSDHAIALATAFGDAIKGTEYARRYMNGVDPIPASVLTELAEHACLCQLDRHPVERDAIRAAYFEQSRAERAAEVEQRRRAFAIFLSQLDNDPAVSKDDSAFRRGTIDAFHHDHGGNGSYAEAQASWGALAMKECVQDAICSLWTEFCRSGLEVQEPDGMTRTQLHQFIFDVLAAHGQLELAGSTITWQPEQPLNGLRDATLAAASAMHWEDVRRWTEQLNTAMSGLAALLWFEAHTPDPGTVLPAWRWVASQDSDHQSGYLRTILAVRGERRTEPSVAEALEWALREFVIGPHEVIAYSKLPESTFRFCWEEGRLRFYPTGHDRFTASGARRNALSSLTEDLGLWSRAGATDTPHLTDAGRAFLTRVFG